MTEQNKDIIDEAEYYAHSILPRGTQWEVVKNTFIAARKQSLSELAEAKEEIAILKASLLKEVEDGFDAGSQAGTNHASEYYNPVQSEKEIKEAKSTYLNQVKERLNIQL